MCHREDRRGRERTNILEEESKRDGEEGGKRGEMEDERKGGEVGTMEGERERENAMIEYFRRRELER